MAVTFTNKAAAEMRHRIESQLAMPLRGMWVGTFHGLAHRFLRSHWQDAGLDQSFQILDADDQLRMVRRVMAALDVDEKKVAAAPVGLVDKRAKRRRITGRAYP